MKKFISAALVVAMVAASCASKEDLGNNNAPQQPAGDGTMTFSADFAEPIAKATPNYNESTHAVTVLWEQNDKVGVYAADDAPVEFTAQASGASTTLNGNIIEADTYYAMYPYDAEATIAAGQISTALPATQTATADAFMAHLAVASTSGSSFSFMNVCGLVRVYVGCEHVTRIEFKGNADETVAGAITVNAATAEYTAVGEDKVITVTPPEDAETFDVGAYYFSVLPQEFSQGFTVTYETADGFKELRQAGNVTIPRSSLVVGKAFTDIQGEGTEADPFVIKTVHDLCNLNAVLSTENPNYVELANDIDMAGVETWTPIANSRKLETTPVIHFDGKNHKITNFSPSAVTAGDGGSQHGFFGTLYGSCKNLALVGVSFLMDGKNLVASVAGFAGYSGTDTFETLFENVHVSGKITAAKVSGGMVAEANSVRFVQCSTSIDLTASDNQSGGFVGRCGSGVNTFVECFATGKLVGSRYTGGFMGGDAADDKVPEKLVFNRCYADVDIDGAYQMGAFLGYTRSETEMTDCYATGTVQATVSSKNSKQCGGLVGVNTAEDVLSVTRCYYLGSIVISQVQAGGIIGLNTGAATVSNCFSIADISAATSTKNNEYGVGGIVGNHKLGSLDVSNCYAAGELNSTDYVGGIVGNAIVAVTVKNCGFGGTLPEGATNCGAIVGIAAATSGNELADCWYFNNTNASSEATVYNGVATTKSASDYESASGVAEQLGWSDETWNLSGDIPTLRCFED